MKPVGRTCFLTGLLFPATVIKMEGKYDVVIRDDDLEGTVLYKDRPEFLLFIGMLHKANTN